MHYHYAMTLNDSDLATWKAFINAHDRITRQINADLARTRPAGAHLVRRALGAAHAARAVAGAWASSPRPSS